MHRELGPGLVESVYEVCLGKELASQGIKYQSQVALPVKYKGEILNKDFYIDMLVEDVLVLELKSVEQLVPVFEAKLLSYLRLADKRLGLLINFNVSLLKDGVRRIINGQI